MTKRAVRLAWAATGLCLALGVAASLYALYGPPEQPQTQAMRELSTLLDLAALFFWLVVFGIYWARKSRREG